MNKNLYASNCPSDEILDYDFLHEERSRCDDPSDLAIWMTGYNYNEEEPFVEKLSAWFERATISISAKTEADYRRVTLRLAKQAMQRWTGNPHYPVHEQDLAFMDFGRIAEEMLASSRAPATKSKYVSALLWALRHTGLIPKGAARDHALRVLGSFKKSKQRKTFVARARKSGRHIPETDLPEILTALDSGRKTPENWASKTQAWLTSGIASGARPGEWEKAFWLDREQGILRLPNLKLKTHAPFDWERIPPRLLHYAARSLLDMAEAEGAEAISAFLEREVRDLHEHFYEAASALEIDPTFIADLKRLRAWELRNNELAWRDVEIHESRRAAVDAHVESVRHFLRSGRKFSTYFENCRSAMQRACVRAFPDRRLYSLYDTRSTASANMQADSSTREAANAMGHYSVETKTIRHNYAGADRSYSRSGRFSPRAADSDAQQRFEAVLNEARILSRSPSGQANTLEAEGEQADLYDDEAGYSAPSFSG